MNTKDNQRSRLTRMLLKQSYIRLMSEKQTGRITVKEICEGAEVNRSTFYLHYTESDGILAELENEAIGLISDALSKIGSLDQDFPGANGYLMSLLHRIRQHEELFRVLLTENADPHFRRRLTEVALDITSKAFRVDLPADKQKTVYLFIVSGSIGVLTEWIRGGFAMSEKNVCDILFRLSEGGLKNTGIG